jgi:hypothetical protein
MMREKPDITDKCSKKPTSGEKKRADAFKNIKT